MNRAAVTLIMLVSLVAAPFGVVAGNAPRAPMAPGPAGFGPVGPPPGYGYQPGPPVQPQPYMQPFCPAPVCGPPVPKQFSGFVGYLGHGNALNVRMDLPPNSAQWDGLISAAHSYRIDGVLAGGSGSIQAGHNLQIMAKGWWLFPVGAGTAHSRSDEYYVLGGATNHRRWDAENQWWTVEASAAYGVNPFAALLGGFRFDSFQTNFRNPAASNLAGGGVADRGDISVTCYKPFLGLALQIPSCNGMTTISGIGLPSVLGEIIYKETFGVAGTRMEANGTFRPLFSGTGYWVEFTGEHGFKMGGTDVTAFVKWTVDHGQADMRVSGAGLVGGNGDYLLTLERQSIVLGGRAAINF